MNDERRNEGIYIVFTESVMSQQFDKLIKDYN